MALTAQVVNVERMRLDQSERGWSGGLEGNLDLRQNQQSVFSAGTNLNVQHHVDSNTLLLVTQAGFIKASEGDLVNFAFAHLRYTKYVNPWLSLEAFTQLQQNRVNGIASRFLAGVGPRYRLFDKKAGAAYVGTLIMYEREREVIDTVGINRDVRLSGYLAASYTPDSANWITVSTTSYYQPRVDNWGDFRVSSESALQVRVRKNLSLTTTFNLVYDSRPPVGLQSTTFAFLNGFKFTFG